MADQIQITTSLGVGSVEVAGGISTYGDARVDLAVGNLDDRVEGTLSKHEAVHLANTLLLHAVEARVMSGLFHYMTDELKWDNDDALKWILFWREYEEEHGG